MYEPTPQTGLLVVVSGPSGVGKTTITRAVVEHFAAVFSVSTTTRPRTEVDVEGRDYHFVDKATFQRMIADDSFLEYARVFDRYYGTPRAPVQRILAQGRIMVLEIDVQGGLQIRQAMPEAFMVFILPPSEDVLLRRLRDRKRESEDRIQRRFQEARSEMKQATESGAYDACIVNDDLDVAIREVINAIRTRLDTARH